MKKLNGLSKARVEKLENDPAGEFRIQIIPDYLKPTESIWAAVSTLDAGNNRGSFFMPEIGDDVIVGFIDGDPAQPVVLGMLHSKNKPTPVTPKDTNHEKGFTTRSKMHITFKDDSKTISIDTPAGNSIVIDESGSKIEIVDQNSNRITMDTTGIKLKSPINVTIESANHITLNAAGDLTLKASRIFSKSSAGTKVDGAGIDLQSSATLSIKGSLVTIN
jgi:uncharacterized protein involved in type VI secretion and phage assembly